MVQTKRLSVSSLSLLSIYNFASELISRPPRYSRRHPDNFRSGLEERGADSQHRARSKSSADSRLQDFCSLICTDGHRLHVFINQSPQNQDPHKMKQRRRHRQKKKGVGAFCSRMSHHFCTTAVRHLSFKKYNYNTQARTQRLSGLCFLKHVRNQSQVRFT